MHEQEHTPHHPTSHDQPDDRHLMPDGSRADRLFDDDEEIAQIWSDQKQISRIEAMRQQAQKTFGKSLPAWRRIPYAVKSALKDSAPANPHRGEHPVNHSTELPTGITEVVHHTKKTVEIKVTLPPLPKLPTYNAMRQRVLHIPRTALIVAGSGLLSIIIVFTAVKLVTANLTNDPSIADETSHSAPGPQTDLKKGTPDFPTIVPAGKDIKALGGWTRVSPPDRDAVFAYVDKIGTTTITVSEQPLPNGFQTNTAQRVSQLAEGYKATEKVQANDITVYIGRSVDGPQSVIFSKSKLLILVKAAAPISHDDWRNYVNSLK